LYLNGEGVDQDYLKAYKLFKQAHDQGYNTLFEVPIKSSLETNDAFMILSMFTKVTEKGIDDLHYLIGSMYEFGMRCIKRDLCINHAAAIKWYLAASKIGDSRADFRLGMMHEEGKGVQENVNAAIRHYKKASIKGNSDASYRLGCLHSCSYIVTKDLILAFHYYTIASNLGHPQATKQLVLSTDDEDTDDKDLQIKVTEKTQVTMLEKVTETGLAMLQYQIGVWYESKKNHLRAFEWLRRAADIGVSDAYYRIGVFYEQGKIVKQDYTMAANMYYNATKKDHEDACYQLGLLYRYGNGIEINDLIAYCFFRRASDRGHINA
jgi:TPR repeat protein